jgi:hypothetical protein
MYPLWRRSVEASRFGKAVGGPENLDRHASTDIRTSVFWTATELIPVRPKIASTSPYRF